MTQLTPEDGVAIVTGAGSGLGRALAVALTQKGFSVIGTGRRLAALEETAAIAQKGLFHAQPVDVSDAAAVTECFATVRDRHGPIALLINNAAVYPRRDFLDESPDSFMQTVAINLGGMVNCSHAALGDMASRGRGRILNVSTYADISPLPASSAYSVSKGAARILTRALIADLGDRFPGIVISDWMPGMLKTTMGIPDGIAPEASADWGARLALMMEPSLTGSTFEMNREVLPPRGLKGKIKDAVLMRRRRARML